MADPWIVKYRPKLLKDIVGQDEVIKKIEKFFTDFKKQKKKVLLLTGPNGSGKTACAIAASNQFDCELIEVNSSDHRNAEQINEKIGNAVKQQSLFMKQKLILIDEIDGLAGNQDRGGIPALADIIAKTTFPVIMTAQDVSESKFSALRKLSTIIELSAVQAEDIVSLLSLIAKHEQIRCEDSALNALARRVGGDVRAAINDFQTLAQPEKSLTIKMLESLGDRDHVEEMQQALIKIFKTTDANIAVTALDHVVEEPNESLLWVEWNVAKEYTKPEDLNRAFESLSRADVFLGRIRRMQHWRFLVYASALMTAGVAVAKDQKYTSPPEYERSKRLLSYWIMNQKYAKRKSIVEKLATFTHTSAKRATNDIFPFMHLFFQKDKSFAQQFTSQLDLEEAEVEWLRK